MKTLLAVFTYGSLAFLTSCATPENSGLTSDFPAPPPSSSHRPASSDDPVLAPDAAPTATPAPPGTDITPPPANTPSSDAMPKPPLPVPMPSASSPDASLATPPSDAPTLPQATPLGGDANANPVSSTKPDVKAITPGATVTTDPSTPAAKAKRDRNAREEYRNYQQRMKERAASDEATENRAQFAHEGGQWQIGLDFAFAALPNYVISSNQTGTTVTANGPSLGGLLSFQYFPLHDISTGRLGFGLIAGAYETKIDTVNGAALSTSLKRKLSIITAGLRVTYEFQYWIAQTLVPFVFAGYDQFNTRARTEIIGSSITFPKDSFGLMNYGLGLSLNLNRLEPEAASKALASTGIKKSYLTYSFVSRDSAKTGPSHLIGLRFEM